MSIDLDSLTEFNADTTFERQSSSIAVVIHLFISSCMNYDVVIDFFIMVSIMFSVNWNIFLCSLRIISFRHIRASFVIPDLKLLKFWRSSLTIGGMFSSVKRSR